MGIYHLVLLFSTSLISVSGQTVDESAAELPKDFYIQRMTGLVFIDCHTLESVVDHKVPLPFYSGDYNITFFSLFKFFWMRFDLNQDANTTVLQKIAERNKVNSEFLSHENSTRVIISFVPKGNILEDTRIVLDVIEKANKIFPGTVPLLIVNYGFLLLDRESVFLVNQDIKRVAREITLYNQNADLRLAVQLDSLNCANRKKYVDMLNLQKFDVFFVPQENSNFDVENANDILLAIPKIGCLHNIGDKWNTRDILLIGQSIPLSVNLNKEYFNFNVAILNLLGNWYELNLKILTIPFKAKLVQHSEDTTTGDKLDLKDFEDWLEQPLQFNRANIGAVIGMQNATQLLVSSTLRNFRKIAIEDIFVNSNIHYIGGAKQFVLNLLNTSNSTEEQLTPLEISLLVKVKNISSEIIREQMSNAVSVAAAGNKFSPGIIRSIVLDWTSCLRSPNDSVYDLQKDQCLYDNIYDDLLDNLLYSKSFLISENLVNEVSLGYVVDDLFLNKLLLIIQNNCSSREKRSIAERDDLSELIFVCQSVLLSKDIEEIGVERSVANVVEELNRCEQISKIAKRVTYHVRVVGCENSSYVSHLAGYASLLEKLSKWAAGENTVLYVDAGIENEEYCSFNLPFSSQSSCTCGWWKQIQSGNGSVLIDKKKLALKLYKGHAVPISSPEKSTDLGEMLPYILVPTVLITIVVTTLATVLVLWYRSKDILSKQEVSDFVYGSRGKNSANRDGDETNENRDSTAESEPFNAKKYEMTPSSFSIDRSRCLGTGEFGKVFRGTVKREDVQIETAVKVAIIPLSGKSHGYYLAVKGLISEIKVLSFLGEHRHIVTLLGAYTAELRRGNIAVFLELCPLGSLDKFLRSYKPLNTTTDNIELNDHGEYIESGWPSSSEGDIPAIEIQNFGLDSEMAKHMQKWVGEIACGMEYISSKKLVHADLATRNVLLTAEKTAKISDFGLSRRLYDYSEYIKKSQCPLPWRWMAPESLCRSIFTEKSDVWAFGVTLWELYTLGDEPYPGLTWNPNFPAMLERGLRLNEPRYSTGNMYEIMKSCWEKNPALRPSFAQLNTELNKE